jgi:hypothetical protein
MRYLTVLLLISTIAFCDNGVQDDWSGGPGVPGPVSDWGNDFSSSILINWSDQIGNLFLDQMASYNQIKRVSDLLWAKPCLLDNDEYPDVFVRSNSPQNAVWYVQGTGGTQWYKRAVSETDEIEDITTGDIDGDGDYDIFASVSNYPSKGFFWYERLNAIGTQWEQHMIDLEDYADRVYSLDFDGDGDIDLIGSYKGKSLSWWENRSNGQNWVKHVISQNTLEHAITSIDVADYDNDGDFDVVCGSSFSDEIYLFENSVSDSWMFHGIEYESGGNFAEVSFADIDGDNLPDLVTSILSSPTDILWFRNTTLADNWGVYLVSTVPGYAYPSAKPGDVDGDGDIDVIASMNSPAPDDPLFFWWENTDPMNGEWICHEILSSEKTAGGYFTQDVNQDGKCDIVSFYRYSSNPVLNKVAWWNLNSGYATGVAQLESSILYVYDVDWGSIDWNATTPDGTSVSFEVRSSDNPEDMGDWSDAISSPGSLAPYLTGNDSYLQYRATLSTTDSTVTPVLENVVLTWSTTGIEGSENSGEITLSVLQNPSAGSARFGVNLPLACDVSLAVYDTAGRMVGNSVSGEYPAGSTVVQFDMLAPGTYFCRMEADNESFSEQFTIVEN